MTWRNVLDEPDDYPAPWLALLVALIIAGGIFVIGFALGSAMSAERTYDTVELTCRFRPNVPAQCHKVVTDAER